MNSLTIVCIVVGLLHFGYCQDDKNDTTTAATDAETKKCGENEEYVECINNYGSCAGPTQQQLCKAGCQCKKDYFRLDKKCVVATECPDVSCPKDSKMLDPCVLIPAQINGKFLKVNAEGKVTGFTDVPINCLMTCAPYCKCDKEGYVAYEDKCVDPKTIKEEESTKKPADKPTEKPTDKPSDESTEKPKEDANKSRSHHHATRHHNNHHHATHHHNKHHHNKNHHNKHHQH